MKDRFDLETEILNLHNTSEALTLIANGMEETLIGFALVDQSDSVVSHSDQLLSVAEAIRGQAHVLSLRADQLFETMTDTLGLDGSGNDKVFNLLYSLEAIEVEMKTLDVLAQQLTYDDILTDNVLQSIAKAMSDISQRVRNHINATAARTSKL